MSKPINKLKVNSFGGLFSDCATHCDAFAACGGNRDSSPCGCVWTIDSGKRHKCGECHIVCRDRKKRGETGLVADFTPHLNAGSLLEQVAVKQDLAMRLPLFIPTSTQYVNGDSIPLPFRWVAADIRMLFNVRKEQPATLKSHFASRNATQNYLNVGPDCNFVAVLNGKDAYLESFWAMKRNNAFKQLYASGFTIGTGPTFSVTNLTYMGTHTPYSHNAAMLMRHHKVVQEMCSAGIEAVPNIYWMDGDKYQLQRWAEWLRENTLIHMVSRDFTSTRTPKAVMGKVRELISLLDSTGRSFHVLIVGTGCKMAPLILNELIQAGHSGSIVTSAPIQHAFRNVKYSLDDNYQIIDKPSLDQSTPFSDLMKHNMKIFEDALVGVVKTSLGKRVLRNSSELVTSEVADCHG